MWVKKISSNKNPQHWILSSEGVEKIRIKILCKKKCMGPSFMRYYRIIPRRTASWLQEMQKKKNDVIHYYYLFEIRDEIYIVMNDTKGCVHHESIIRLHLPVKLSRILCIRFSAREKLLPSNGFYNKYLAVVTTYKSAY